MLLDLVGERPNPAVDVERIKLRSSVQIRQIGTHIMYGVEEGLPLTLLTIRTVVHVLRVRLADAHDCLGGGHHTPFNGAYSPSEVARMNYLLAPACRR